MTQRVRPDFKKRRLHGGYDYPCIDLKSLSKRELASVLMDAEAMGRANSIVSSNTQAFGDFAAVYFIGLRNSRVTKIGFSNNPASRIRQLQTALWDDVVCHGLIWAPFNVETKALRLAKRESLRLRGEWVNLPADEAVGLALTAMEGHEAFADSLTFAEHWSPHLVHLYSRGGDHALALRRQASEDALRSGSPQPVPSGWIYQTA